MQSDGHVGGQYDVSENALHAVKVWRHTPWSRGPLSWLPGMLVHALSISLSISFATAQSSHNSEIYNIGELWNRDNGASDIWALTAYWPILHCHMVRVENLMHVHTMYIISSVERQKGIISRYSTMFHWEPEGCYCCTKFMAIAANWSSTEHRWVVHDAHLVLRLYQHYRLWPHFINKLLSHR